MNTITAHRMNPQDAMIDYSPYPWEVFIEMNPLFDANNPNTQSKYLYTLKVREVEASTPAPIVSPIQITYVDQSLNQTIIHLESNARVHLHDRLAAQENVLSRMASGVASYLTAGVASRMVLGLASYAVSSLVNGASEVFHSTGNCAHALWQLGRTLFAYFAYCASNDRVKDMLAYVIMGLFIISISIIMNGTSADLETAVNDVVDTTLSLL